MLGILGVAFAMGGQPQAGGQAAQGNWFTSLLPLVIIFGIFYFLLIRPQQKQQKKFKEMLSAVKRGDKIVTRGGIHAVVTGITDKVLQIEIAENIKVKINRDAIAYIDQSTDESLEKTENK